MRGSSLVWPAVLETLRPFIVTSSTGRTTEDLSPELQSLYREAGFRDTHVNFVLFVLDADGKLLRAVQPNVRPPAHRFDPESQGRDFKRQIDQLLDRLPLPKEPPSTRMKLKLPDVADGVRIYLSFGKNNINHYRTPTVEAVALTDEMKQALRYSEQARDVTAQELQPILEQFYPPAIMDGSGGFSGIKGTLKLKPAGKDDTHRYAIAEGKVTFIMDNHNRTTYTCTVYLALKYPNDLPEKFTLRGVAEGAVPKYNQQGQVVERVKMTAAIESRPE